MRGPLSQTDRRRSSCIPLRPGRIKRRASILSGPGDGRTLGRGANPTGRVTKTSSRRRARDLSPLAEDRRDAVLRHHHTQDVEAIYRLKLPLVLAYRINRYCAGPVA
jgi:hypothetical protein